MNGRVYDYNLGRFLGVDPFLQFPESSQSANPYSYIMNNPMAGTDSTGYFVDDPTGTQWANAVANNEEGNMDCMSSASKASCRTANERISNGQSNDRKGSAVEDKLNSRKNNGTSRNDGSNSTGGDSSGLTSYIDTAISKVNSKLDFLSDDNPDSEGMADLRSWMGTTNEETITELTARLENISFVLNKWKSDPSLIRQDSGLSEFGHIASAGNGSHKLWLGSKWINASNGSSDKYSTFIHEAAHFNFSSGGRKFEGGTHNIFNGLTGSLGARALANHALLNKQVTTAYGTQSARSLSRQNPWVVEYWVSGVKSTSY